MTYKAVLCDFYGTLAESPSWGPSWEEIMGDLGYTLPPEVRDRWWNDGIDGIEHHEHSRSRDHYVAWQHARMKAMLRECGVPDHDAGLVIERVRSIGAHRRIDAYEETHEVLDDLRARGVTLAICSNWDWDLLDAVDAAGLTDTIDVVVSSAWVGARKPHPRIYAHTLAEVGVDPADALFVGDTWGPDVDGPRTHGMTPVYVRRAHREPDTTAPADHGHQPVHRFPDLRGLLDLV